jgi:hypothetical protein
VDTAQFTWLVVRPTSLCHQLFKFRFRLAHSLGELVKIKVEEVDFERRTIRVVGKGSARIVFGASEHLPPHTCATGGVETCSFQNTSGRRVASDGTLGVGAGTLLITALAKKQSTPAREVPIKRHGVFLYAKSRLYCPFKQSPISTHAPWHFGVTVPARVKSADFPLFKTPVNTGPATYHTISRWSPHNFDRARCVASDCLRNTAQQDPI